MAEKFTDLSGLAPLQETVDGTSVRAITGENLQVIRTTIEPGSTFAPHSHPHEQFLLILEGALEFTIDGETKTLGAGGVFYAAPGAPHGGRVIGDERVVLIEVFHPVREDYTDRATGVSHEQPR